MAENTYTTLLVFLGMAVGFAAAPICLALLWAKCFTPRKNGAVKNAVYECGLPSNSKDWVQFKSDYYLYGIIFLVFDIETIFLLPFAVAFKGLPTGAIVAMILFLLLLVEGLVWAWRKGVLNWK
jgi:NADH-quinone oxidoreductase subunit A